jgi:DNA invertase Pin-like site-specific DNA recombinase
MACFLALYAQWKSDTMSERIKEGNAAKRAARDEPEKRQIVRVDKALSLPSRYRYLKRKTESLAAATPGTFYTYARKSHSDVHPERLMKAQLDNALRYGRRLAQKHPGLTLSDQPYIDDGVSAYKVPFRGRPAGKLLFEMVKPGDCIGFGRFDRAFRNPIDARQTEADLRARGVSCHFCNVHIDATTAIGQAMLTILATLAELEAAEIGMKMKAILGWLADQGRPVNQKTPRGWYRKRFGKCIRFEPDWQEIDRIQVAHYLHKELGWTLWSISDLFEQQIAEEENRSMLPRHGTGEVGGRGRAAYRPRRWRTGNLWYAIQEWPELAEMLEVS